MISSTIRKPSSDGWIIPLHELPKTFKDSICTLHRLGFQYVWIDSLCIVQDDLDDIEREIYQMPHIYKNSQLTLCTSTARSCDIGILQPRPDHSESQLQLSMPNGKFGTIYLDRIPWSFPPATEPLGTRAWALQERFLSPRLLEYGWRTLRWSCSCSERYSGYQPLPALTESDRGPLLTPSYNLFGYLNPNGIRRIPQRRDDLFDRWVGIVHQYTRPDLTFPDDRLAAIGGVAAEIQERTGVPYLAGLWDYDRLPSLLLWRVDSPLCELHPRPKSRAPSWSWVAVDGAVSINHSRAVVQSFRVLDTDISGGFGLSARGSVTVEGLVREGLWWYEGWNVTEPLLALGTAALRRRDDELTIFPDCAGEAFEFLDDAALIKSFDLTFLAIGRADWDHDIVRGLILSMNGKYHRRVGLFQVRTKHSVLMEDWSVGVLCIV